MDEALGRLLEARTVEEVWAVLCERMAGFGFDRLLYAYTRTDAGSRVGRPDDALILSNHDPAYLRRFIGEGLYLDAPMVRWAAENDGVCSWSLIGRLSEAGQLSEAERRVIAFNRQCNVFAGYSISFRELSVQAWGGIGLAARAGLSQAEVNEIWASEGRDIVVLNKVAHLRITSLPYPAAQGPLTQRQREVLRWVAEGKTTQDIAILMGLSLATVEKHLRLARAALDVDSTAQAVAKASLMNKLFIFESAEKGGSGPQVRKS